MALTKKAIKAALLAGKEVVTKNSHCKTFGGAHRYWIETDADGDQVVRGYGSGPNWRDRDANLCHPCDVDRHVDTIYENGNAEFFDRESMY